MVKSKQKGNAFENKILKELRTIDPMSHRTIGSGNSKDDKGDIAFRNYLIELKHHKSFTDGEIEKYWQKIKKEARAANKYPLLIYKENRRKTLVMMDCLPGIGRVIMLYDEWFAEQKR